MNGISFKYKTIKTNSLQLDEKWCLHPLSDHVAKDIEDSFLETGIINPPTVRAGVHQYELVCGHKRVNFLLANNCPSITVRVLPNNISTQQLLQIVLTDQLLSAPLTIVQRAFFLQLASQYLTESEILSQFAKQLPCKKHKSAISEHLQLLKAEKEILKLIHDGIISEQTALSIINMTKKDQTVVSQLINNLRPGAGKQKRIVTMLEDLSKREDLSISTYLEQENIAEVLAHENMNPPQKVQQLIELLQSKHTPSLQRAENEFKREVQSLNLPSYAQISPSQSFEKDSAFLTIEFSSLSDIRNKWPEIEKVIKKQ